MDQDKEKAAALLLGKAYRLEELCGWAAKSLVVPPGRLGLVVDATSIGRTLAPGKHTILSAFERLQGKGGGLIAGYVPGGTFSAWLGVVNLQAGDEQWVDISLFCSLELSEPLRFFCEQVVPRRELLASTPGLGSEVLPQALLTVTRSYEAADLQGEHLPLRLPGELHDALLPALASIGIGLVGLRLVTFRPSEGRADIAVRAQKLQDELQQEGAGEQAGEITSPAQLEDFVRQRDPQLAEVVGVAAGGETTPGEGTGVTLWDWLNQLSSQEGQMRLWRLDEVFRCKFSELPAEGSASCQDESIDSEQGVLGSVSGQHRQRMDALVREQCAAELTHACELLNTLRRRLFTDNQEDLALRMRRLENDINALVEKVGEPTFGTAPYLGEMKISPQAWADMLSYNERLLIQALAFNEGAALVEGRHIAGQLDASLLSKIGERLTQFQHRFANRGRVLHPPQNVQDVYRLDL